MDRTSKVGHEQLGESEKLGLAMKKGLHQVSLESGTYITGDQRAAYRGNSTIFKGIPGLILLAWGQWFCTLPSSHSSKLAGESSGPTCTIRSKSQDSYHQEE